MSITPTSPRCFIVLENALELIAMLHEPLKGIRAADTDLAKQIRRAATSIALNLGEGQRRRGKDRIHHYRIAAGSADEVRVALRISVMWRYIKEEDVAAMLDQIDGINAMLYRITER